MKAARKNVFVTVGTTKFDELIETVLSSEVLQALSLRGYDKIILQIGKSSIIPDCTSRCGFVNIEYFHSSPSIYDYIESADLVISHAGAGSILEALEAKKHLLVVVNRLLMHNHQFELAEQLYADRHLYYCTCDTLLNVIETMDLKMLKPWDYDKSRGIANFINEIMGFR